MRYTLLEMTQRLLESMDGEEINSISDTTEAMAVANIVKENYYYILTRTPSKRQHGLFNLNSSGDNNKPALMTLPTYVSTVETLKYNISETESDGDFKELQPLELEEFLDLTDNLSTAEDYVGSQTVSLDGGTFRFKFRTDSEPSYFTTVDQFNLIFDACNTVRDTTLTSARTKGYGLIIPTFTMTDNFVPDLDPRQFQLLLDASKTQAFLEIKQVENAHAARRERVGNLISQKIAGDVIGTTPRKYKGFGR